jgi:peroxiredoxin
MRRVAKVGSRAPGFTLPNAVSQPVGLGELRARGPVVLSFYRGRW